MKKDVLLIALALTLVIPIGISNSLKVNASTSGYFLYVNIIGDGIVSINGSSPYWPGSTVVCTATPEYGWTFSGWSGDLTGTANPALVNMTSNKTITATFTRMLATIESCDSIGATKDTFHVMADVFVTGTGYANSSTYDLYVVVDEAVWSDNMTIPTRVFGTATTIKSNSAGNVPPTVVWTGPLVVGNYDVVVDVNGNGRYDELVDALDDMDVEVTSGFNVIPEVSLGTIGIVAAMGLALLGYISIKKPRRNKIETS